MDSKMGSKYTYPSMCRYPVRVGYATALATSSGRDYLLRGPGYETRPMAGIVVLEGFSAEKLIF